jgi:hypothetical protein
MILATYVARMGQIRHFSIAKYQWKKETGEKRVPGEG